MVPELFAGMRSFGTEPGLGAHGAVRGVPRIATPKPEPEPELAEPTTAHTDTSGSESPDTPLSGTSNNGDTVVKVQLNEEVASPPFPLELVSDKLPVSHAAASVITLDSPTHFLSSAAEGDAADSASHLDRPSSISPPVPDAGAQLIATSGQQPYFRLAPTTSQLTYLPHPHSYVHLQYLHLSPARPPRLHGAVLVRNVVFAKSVNIRYTMNNWEAKHEIKASYSLPLPRGIVPGSCDTSWDKFTFTIKLDDFEHSLHNFTLFLAVRYIAHDVGEWWDNNLNQNYRVQFEYWDSNETDLKLNPSGFSTREHRFSLSGQFSPFSCKLDATPILDLDAPPANLRSHSPSVEDLETSLIHYLEMMECELRFNPCGREVSPVPDADIPKLSDIVNRAISPELLHACCFWGHYVENVPRSEALFSSIYDFLSTHLLHWMEVLNLKHCLYEGVLTLSRVQKWLRECVAPLSIHDLTQDARQFVMSFAASPISTCTPSIYLLALPAWPTESPVSYSYRENIWESQQMAKVPKNEDNPCLLWTWFAGSGIHSISASLDGTLLLSGSGSIHRPVKLWDLDNLNELNVERPGLTDHKDFIRGVVSCVAFSSNGSHIAVGSHDHSVVIWDIRLGKPSRKLESHSNTINSIAFSSKCTHIATGSEDCTIKIWAVSQPNLTDPPLLQSFSPHNNPVRSVTFSPDGNLIASGSNDCRICVVDARSGHLRFGPFIGHTGAVNSVAFSPNGKLIVSGSSDNTIRVWDCSNESGLCNAEFRGHTNSVNSVGFSPDGTCVVSGSSDQTICVWNADDGKEIAGPFLGHTKPVKSVIFTPDGTRIISGSDDQTIRMWDVDLPGSHMKPGLRGGMRRAISYIQRHEVTTTEMFQCLVDHGCRDLTPAINLNGTSPEMIYRGHLGDTWKSELYNGTGVAIKVWIFSPLPEDKKGLKRAMREIYNWSKINHKNIHKLLGVTMFQGRLGMVSRWMKHGNLEEYIRKNQAVDRYQLCIQVTIGLQYLHDRNMVHGDLKARNILVSQDGVAKLADFDNSVISDCSLRFSETSHPGGGTLRWMAPELVVPDPCHQKDKRTDIYALGMTFLEIITGKVPYHSQCPKDFHIVKKLLREELPEQTEQFTQSSRGVKMWDLMVECWNYDSDARPTAGKALLSLLNLVETTTP